MPWTHRLQVAFRHARTTRRVTVRLGWLQLRIPATQQVVWALVIRDPDVQRRLLLLTNISITIPQEAETVYTEWRFCPCIEHTWPRPAVFWLRRLGGKLGLTTDSDGPQVLLAGITALFVTIGTLSYASHHPFPRPSDTYG